MALERTNSAMVVSLTPACVSRFMQQPHATAKLREFQAIDTWRQREFVEAGGWTTFAGDRNRTAAWPARVRRSSSSGRSRRTAARAARSPARSQFSIRAEAANEVADAGPSMERRRASAGRLLIDPLVSAAE
jgi:hypothetical protein